MVQGSKDPSSRLARPSGSRIPGLHGSKVARSQNKVTNSKVLGRKFQDYRVWRFQGCNVAGQEEKGSKPGSKIPRLEDSKAFRPTISQGPQVSNLLKILGFQPGQQGLKLEHSSITPKYHNSNTPRFPVPRESILTKCQKLPDFFPGYQDCSRMFKNEVPTFHAML